MLPPRLLARLFTAAAALAGVAWAGAPALTAADQAQPRLDLAAPVPLGSHTLEQSFVPAHNGLSTVEVLAVVYPASNSPTSAPHLTLSLAGPGGPVAERAFTNFEHNQPLPFSFQPQPASAGQVYTLTLRGSPNNTATAWAYSLNGYESGNARFAGQPLPGDLNFSTRYTYLWPDLARNLWSAVAPLARLALPLWLLLIAPGWLLLDLYPGLTPRRPGRLLPRDPARLGTVMALSLAGLVVAWLWMGTLGLRWSPAGLVVVYGVLGVVAGIRWLLRVRHLARRPHAKRDWTVTTLLASLLLLGFVSRLAAVRDVILPQWVDGAHHYAIARVLELAGNVPPSYAPLLPVEHFQYHFGFHALAVSAHWLSGLSLLDTFLWLEPVLQGLVPLSAYAAVASLTRRPRAGLLAAVFVAGVSYFPGYYATWGRYTQLAALVIFFPALAGAVRLVRVPPLSTGPSSRVRAHARLGGLALLAAGLLLTHYPVFMLWLAWAVILAAFAFGPCLARRLLTAHRTSASTHSSLGPARPRFVGLGVPFSAALFTVVLVAPWLWRLGRRVVPSWLQQPALFTAPAGYNAFPVDYFSSPLERAWIGLALAAVLWGLWLRDGLLARLAVWCALLFVVVNLGQGNWLVNNNTLAITAFVPGAIALGWGADRWLALAEQLMRKHLSSGGLWGRLRPQAGAVMRLGLIAAVGCGVARGLTTQAGLINPVTVLATAKDREALDWIEAHTPPEAIFAINAWEWLNGTWAGSDGGAWIWPLTGRRTTLPPADYAYGSPESQDAINDYNRRLFQMPELSAPAGLALLREAGVTHVYLGARGGPLRPEQFAPDPHYRLAFTNGAVWVFEVLP